MGPRAPGLRSLSVVLPAFDEAACIAVSVRGALAYLDRRGLDGEVIVVDDGSADGTARAASGEARVDRRVRVVEHGRNRGYGAAIRSGIAAAAGEHVFVTDADQQFDLTDLDRLAPWVGGYDLVVGYRSPRADPRWRRAAGWAWNAASNALLQVGVRDVDCAFKLVHRRVFERVALRCDGAAVSPELLVRARRAGFRVKEVAVRHHPRAAGRATGGHPRVVGRAAWELARLRAELGERPW